MSWTIFVTGGPYSVREVCRSFSSFGVPGLSASIGQFEGLAMGPGDDIFLVGEPSEFFVLHSIPEPGQALALAVTLGVAFLKCRRRACWGIAARLIGQATSALSWSRDQRRLVGRSDPLWES
jgi:hypothetical protein